MRSPRLLVYEKRAVSFTPAALFFSYQARYLTEKLACPTVLTMTSNPPLVMPIKWQSDVLLSWIYRGNHGI
jgi:hypothetical protein